MALASLILLPEVNNSFGVVDHELAYPRMILSLMPVGFKGLMIAAFFAAFMSTVDTHLNWGSSYVVHDVYRRFVKREASPEHYVGVARLVTFFLMVGGGIIAFTTSSIVEAFYNVLLLFSGVGLVGLARWFWWRVTAWSEITAMLASGLLTLFVSPIARVLGWPDARPIHLIIVVFGSTVLWVAATFLTKPIPEERLKLFYERIRPAGPGWKPIAKLSPQVVAPDSLTRSAWGWAMGVFFIYGATIAIGKGLLGSWTHAIVAAIFALVGLLGVLTAVRRMRWDV